MARYRFTIPANVIAYATLEARDRATACKKLWRLLCIQAGESDDADTIRLPLDTGIDKHRALVEIDLDTLHGAIAEEMLPWLLARGA